MKYPVTPGQNDRRLRAVQKNVAIATGVEEIATRQLGNEAPQSRLQVRKRQLSGCTGNRRPQSPCCRQIRETTRCNRNCNPSTCLKLRCNSPVECINFY